MLELVVAAALLGSPCENGTCKKPILKLAKSPITVTVEVFGVVADREKRVEKREARVFSPIRKTREGVRGVGIRIRNFPVVRRIKFTK